MERWRQMNEYDGLNPVTLNRYLHNKRKNKFPHLILIKN